MIMIEHFSGNNPLTPNLLGLDFANTLSSRGSDQPSDRLLQYTGLLEWSEQIGLLRPVEAQTLANRARKDPEKALQVY
ncbi:MAG TPA: ABATE domain-containing protein, partial [Anaerolineales bacterium]|nr:ABATE domain-containing protein [Anaerolineales bacterium]